MNVEDEGFETKTVHKNSNIGVTICVICDNVEFRWYSLLLLPYSELLYLSSATTDYTTASFSRRKSLGEDRIDTDSVGSAAA